MAITKEAVSAFVTDQVKSGASVDVRHAEQELIARAIEMDIDRRIAEGREQIKNGECFELTDESIEALAEEIAQAV